MKQYSRVTYEERCQIFALLQVKMNISEIAAVLNRHKSTISRELKRTTTYWSLYTPQVAQKLRQTSQSKQKRPKMISGHLKEVIESKLKKRWSPDLISGRMKDERVSTVSRQTIYNHVKRNRPLKQYLKFSTNYGAGRMLQRRQNKEKYLSIHKRPASANKRTRFGHWERDGMYAGNREQVLVCLERKSRMVILEPIGKVTSKKVNELTKKVLKNKKVLTITNDNGPEFRKKLNWNVPVFYCDPMKPNQRGSVENVIGTIRMFISRKTDLNELGRSGIKEVEREINLRPRKIFNYKTPYEIYFNKKVALVT